MVTASYLTDITGPMGPVGDLARGVMPLNSNANSFTTSGLWYTGGVGIIETQVNLAVNIPSEFFVLASSAPFSITQFQMPSTLNDTNVYWRSKVSGNATIAGWSGWKPLNSARGELPANTNVYDMRGPQWVGVWDISGGETAGTMLGAPPAGMASWLPGQIEVKGGGGGSTNLSTIVYTPYAPAALVQQVWTTTIKAYSLTGEAAWSGWVDLANGGGGSGSAATFGAGTPNDMRIQAFKDEYPLVTTGNKGCVVFRYDHGLTNFKSTLWAMHRDAGIPAYIAMNSRLWNIAENSGASQSDAKSWIATGLVRFGNHTSDHKDRNTAEGIFDTIVNGRKELESQLGRIIHGFTVPGLTEYNKFEGFGGGSLDTYSETLAGSLILANHAIASGAIGSIQRPLDGVIRQGGRHFGWEDATFATVKAQIDSAISNKTALTLMLHPRTMGLSGYWTPALAQQVISYVKSKIDAGQLANISYYQSHHAKL